MVTAESVKAKLQGLIGKANGVTGRSDGTLTQAVAALIAGFGQGGTAVQTGSFTPAENLTGIALPVEGACSNVALWRVSTELPGEVRILQRFIGLDLSKAGPGLSCWHTWASNGSGTTLNAATYGDDFVPVITDGQLVLSFNPGAYGLGYLAAGYEYLWLAW